jgi:hypothetical protein
MLQCAGKEKRDFFIIEEERGKKLWHIISVHDVNTWKDRIRRSITGRYLTPFIQAPPLFIRR